MTKITSHFFENLTLISYHDDDVLLTSLKPTYPTQYGPRLPARFLSLQTTPVQILRAITQLGETLPTGKNPHTKAVEAVEAIEAVAHV